MWWSYSWSGKGWVRLSICMVKRIKMHGGGSWSGATYRVISWSVFFSLLFSFVFERSFWKTEWLAVVGWGRRRAQWIFMEDWWREKGMGIEELGVTGGLGHAWVRGDMGVGHAWFMNGRGVYHGEVGWAEWSCRGYVVGSGGHDGFRVRWLVRIGRGIYLGEGASMKEWEVMMERNLHLLTEF